MSTGNPHFIDENNKAVSPFHYEIDSVVITTNTGFEINATAFVHNVLIHEALHRSSIIVEVYLNDTVNLYHHAKLAGNEKVKIKIGRDEEELGQVGFELEVYISDINNYSERTPTDKSYNLVCVPKHVYLNNRRLLNTSFTGGLATTIKQIVTSKTILDTPKIHMRANSQGQMKGIIPNLKPLDAINWLLRNASDNNTPMYFYETAAEGLVLNSYNNILTDPVHFKYNKYPMFEKSMIEGKTKEMFNEERSKIRSLGTNIGVSKFNAADRGTYGGVINTIDISNKRTPDKKEYRYLTDAPNRYLNDNPPFEKDMNIDELEIHELKDAKQLFVNTNNLAFSNGSNHIPTYHTQADSKKLFKANAIRNNLNAVRLNLTIGGDFELAVGKVIELDMLTRANIAEEMEEGLDFNDEYLSGKYLITALTHDFNKNAYICKATVKKDSFKTKQLDELGKG